MTIRKSPFSSPFSSGLVLVVAILAASGWASDGAASHACGQEAGLVTLVGGKILRPDGTLHEDMAVVIRDGKIKRLASARAARTGTIRRFDEQTVVFPGMIDLFSSIGTGGQSLETLAAVDADASALDAIAPNDREFSAAIRAGITSAMVAPAPSSLVAGTAVTFRTFAIDGQLDVLRDDGPLLCAFGRGVWRNERPPTSRAGTLLALRNLVEQARRGDAPPRINAALAGHLDSLLVCDSADNLVAVRNVLGDDANRFGIVHTADAVGLATELDGYARPMVVGPYDFTSSRRALLGAATLSKAKIEVAFAGGIPKTTPETLRITAAIAIRYGMDTAAARRAMTINPARVAGVAEQVGSIAPGKDGDLVVFSRDPLRLDATVLEVYIKGRRVFAAANQDSPGAGATQ